VILEYAPASAIRQHEHVAQDVTDGDLQIEHFRPPDPAYGILPALDVITNDTERTGEDPTYCRRAGTGRGRG
jgi:hypothetical protein